MAAACTSWSRRQDAFKRHRHLDMLLLSEGAALAVYYWMKSHFTYMGMATHNFEQFLTIVGAGIAPFSRISRPVCGMGLALAAELNGYPGPAHVIELAKSLGLSEPQRAKPPGSKLNIGAVQSSGWHAR